MIRVLAVLVSVGLVVGLRAASSAPEVLELSDVGQGLSTFDVADAGHVFVLREGLLVYAWKPATAAGKAIQYCPRESVFFAPATKAVYDRYGNPERFGSVDRDRMVPLATSIDADFRVHVADRASTQAPPREKVRGAVMDFFSRWLNSDFNPTNRTLVWCPNPVR